MSSLTSSLTIHLIDDVSAPAKTVAQALKTAEQNAKAVASAMSNTGATDRFVNSLSRLKLSAGDIETVSRAWRDYTTSAGLAGNAASWTKTQAGQVRAWEAQTLSSLRAVKREQQQFYQAQEKAVALASRGPAAGLNMGVLGGVMGLAAASKAKQFAGNAIHTYRDYSDINAISRPVLDLSPEEQERFKAQQRELGVKSRYSPVKIAEAQKLLGERGVGQTSDTRWQIERYVPELINYASAMNVELPEAVRAAEAFMFSTGKLKGVTDPERGAAIVRRGTDYMTHLSKISGLSNDELSSFFEYGGLSGKQAGLSDETVGAMAALMKRNQISGEKAGVAMRAISAKLVSPTSKGLASLSAMGINYDDFAKLKGGLSGENVSLATQRQFGKQLSEDQVARINEALQKSEVAGDRGAFTTAVADIVAESFAKNKKGQLAAKDAKDIAKTLGQLYSMSSEVDSEGLINAIANAKATLAQMNAFFGFQQGSRAGAALMAPKELQESRRKLVETPEGYSANIATERLNSFAGAMSRLEGSIETLQIKVSESFDNYGKGGGAMTLFVNALEKGANALISLPDGLLRLGTEAAAAATVFAALKGMGAIAGGLGAGGLATTLGGAASLVPPVAAAAAGGLIAYEATKALDENARKGTKEAGRTYTSDALLGFSNWLAGFTGGKTDVGKRPDFDVEAYAARARAKAQFEVPQMLRPQPSASIADPGALTAASANARPGVDLTSIEAVKPAADAAGQALHQSLDTTAKPTVDVSSLREMLGLLQDIEAKKQALASPVTIPVTMAVRGLGAVNAAIGSAQRGRFTTGGVQGD